MLEILPEWFRIFFFSMIPWLESRYVIPFAINIGWDWWKAFPIAVAGNILPIPIILLFFKKVEKWLRRYRFWSKLMDWLFSRTRDRANEVIRRYEYLGLLVFVALPFPFTGAWTGALIAYLFNLKFGKSLITIFFGVISASGIMTIVTLTGIDLLYIVLGVIIIGFIMGLFIFYGSYKKK
jgi:uncharacterized membrane protein